MKKIWLSSFIVIAALGLLLTGCEKMNNPMANIDDNPDVFLTDPIPPATAYTTPIMAGQTIDVGDVYVWFHGDYIYVQYQTDSPWLLTEVHVDVATTVEGLEHSGGGLVPGQFVYKDEFDPINIYTVEIPLEEWEEEEMLCMAAHCCVFNDADNDGYYDEGEQEETGWGDGEDYPGANWSMYFCIEVRKSVSLPPLTDNIQARYISTVSVSEGGIPSKFQLRYVDPGYDITNTTYPSYCLDLHVLITSGWKNVDLYSSYDPAMPNYAKYNRGTTTPTPYDKINYLLNTYPHPYVSPYTMIKRLQHCFWYYRGDLTYDQLSSAEKLMVDDADANGIGYYPPAGGWMAILLDFGTSIQLCFIEIDP